MRRSPKTTVSNLCVGSRDRRHIKSSVVHYTDVLRTNVRDANQVLHMMIIHRCRQPLFVAATLALTLAAGVSAQAELPAAALDAVRVKNFEIAAHTLNEYAERGDLDASYHLAGLYRRGLGVNKDDRKADELYRQLRNAGHQRALAAKGERDIEYWWLATIETDPAAALHWSAQRGLVSVVVELLSAGAPVDAELAFGRTALIEAAESNQAEIITLLIEAGADTSHVDAWGDSALVLAVRRGNEAATVSLLAAGANPNLAGSGKNTPLIIAAQKNLDAVARALTDSGALLDATNEAGQSALGIAEVRGHKQLAAMLRQRGAISKGFEARRRSSLDGLQLNTGNSNDRSIWFIAAERGLADALSTLLSSGANPNQRDSSGATALMVAAERGELEAVQVLLTNGANATLKNAADATALQLAVNSGKAAIVRALLDRTPVDADAGGKLLRLAVTSGSDETLTALLAAGIADAADADTGRTALMLAAAQKKDSMLRALLDAGGDANAVDAHGRNGGWYAADAGSVQNILLISGAGADFARADEFGDTALHRAAARGYSSAVKTLSDIAALNDTPNKQGLSPIMLAAINGWPEIVDALLAAGHDLERQNFAGNTALHICVQRGDALGVQHLLANRADPGAVNSSRMNAIDIAERLGHKTVLALLK